MVGAFLMLFFERMMRMKLFGKLFRGRDAPSNSTAGSGYGFFMGSTASPLFLLRCVQLGISIRDLDLLTIGMVNDMFVESRNDEYKGWRQVATQEDFDRF